MIAGVMAAVLATQGTAWASTWALCCRLQSEYLPFPNWDPRKKEENAIEDKKIDQRNNKDIKNRKRRSVLDGSAHFFFCHEICCF